MYKLNDDKQRLIQEYVPGKQITLAHIIANPDKEIYEKLGLIYDENIRNALGILTITPSEAAIIAVDIAVKSANVKIGFMDRFSGSVVITGDVSSVQTSLEEVLTGLGKILGFNETGITKT